jgi:hypothetical protein
VRKSKTDPALIPVFVDEGLSDLEIAKRMGWTAGTLRVRCSQLKISLRRKVATGKVASGKHVVLPRAIFDQLHERAVLMGVSMSALASDLLEVIARDSLYDAVLDRDDTGLTRRNASVN